MRVEKGKKPEKRKPILYTSGGKQMFLYKRFCADCFQYSLNGE